MKQTLPATPDDPSGKRQKAEAWVNAFTITAAGLVLAGAGIPGAASVVLLKLEVTMLLQIGRIYRCRGWSLLEAKSASGGIGLAAVAGKVLALEATILLGPFAFAAKPVIAAGIVKTLGQVVIAYFEQMEIAQGDGQ